MQILGPSPGLLNQEILEIEPRNANVLISLEFGEEFSPELNALQLTYSQKECWKLETLDQFQIKQSQYQ